MKRQLCRSVALVAFGMLVGLLLSPETTRERELSGQIARAISEINSLRRNVSVASTHANSNGPGTTRLFPASEDPAIQIPIQQQIDDYQSQTSAGEFVLPFEHPIMTKALQDGIKGHVLKTSQQNAVELSEVFAGLGIAPEVSDKLQKHRAKIEFASIFGQEVLSHLAQAKRRYDESLKAELTPEKYTHYREYEETLPVRREFKEFQTFAEGKGASLNAEDQQRLFAAMVQAQLSPREIDFGPYSGPPNPILGKEASLSYTQERRDLYARSIEQLRAEPPASRKILCRCWMNI